MPRGLANLIDALIPGAFGLAILLFPTLFAGNNASIEKLGKLKKIGIVLIVISIGYLLLKIAAS